MMRVGSTCLVVILCSSLATAAAESKRDAQAAKHFVVQWSSVQYNKTLAVQNPTIFQNPQETNENLTLQCQVEIRDPDLVLGTSSTGVITQLTDGNGQNVVVGTPASNPREMYEGLRYQNRFRQPAPLPQWLAFIRRTLGYPPQPFSPPQMVEELAPSQIRMPLDLGLLDQAGGELRSVKGYFFALVADSMEYVDVPFEPNNTWVRLTPDVEIRVAEAVQMDRSFRYKIDVSPQGGRVGRPSIVGTPLPARLALGQQFIGDDGKPVNRHSFGFGAVISHIGGTGNHSGDIGQVKAIRFVIAVNATDCKIPFELRKVPLPSP